MKLTKVESGAETRYELDIGNKYSNGYIKAVGELGGVCMEQKNTCDDEGDRILTVIPFYSTEDITLGEIKLMVRIIGLVDDIDTNKKAIKDVKKEAHKHEGRFLRVKRLYPSLSWPSRMLSG